MPQTIVSMSNLQTKLTRSFGVMLLVLLTLLGFAIWSFRRLSEANDWKVHTYKVLLESQSLEQSLFSIDNAVRGYIVSGEQQNLSDLEEGKSDFRAHLTALQTLVSDNPSQGVRLQEVYDHKERYLQIVGPVIDNRLPSDTSEQAVIKSSRTVKARRAELASVRQTMTAFEDTEDVLLKQRVQTYKQWQLWSEVTLWVGSAFSILLTLFLSSLGVRAVRESASAYSRLRESNNQLEFSNTQLALAKDGLEVEVAQRRTAEERLSRAVNELKRSNTELEQFAYVASHDLQEPLRAVAGCVQVLKRRYEGKLDDRADQFIGHAVDGAQRMQNLIQDLLAYSRVGTKGKPFSEVSLDKIMDNVMLSLTTVIKESAAHIERVPLPTVYGDAGQLEQVLQNLISNAIKFRGEAPPQVKINCVRVEDKDRGHGWTISVADQGPGIEAQYFERIFVMFQRLHTRTEYAGTGIGLAIVKKIIERHSGRIWVESEVGQGTTFSFWIPQHATDPSQADDTILNGLLHDAPSTEKQTQEATLNRV